MEWAKAIDNMGYMSHGSKIRNHLPIDSKRSISVQASKFHKSHRKDRAPKHRDSIIYYNTVEVQLHGVTKEDLQDFVQLINLEKYKESEKRPFLYYHMPLKLADELISYLYKL